MCVIGLSMLMVGPIYTVQYSLQGLGTKRFKSSNLVENGGWVNESSYLVSVCKHAQVFIPVPLALPYSTGPALVIYRQ